MHKLSLDGEVFRELKTDFEEAMHETLLRMQKTETRSASLNVKLTVTLEKRASMDGELYLSPRFEHRISTDISIKDSRDGFVEKEYRLVYDENNAFGLEETDDGQLKMEG